jgi:hypothetical protein
MARNDEIISKNDPGDVKAYDKLVNKALIAKRKIEIGFLDLAESIFELNKTKLYRVKYKTFAEFCDEELGFSRQTIYVYLSILKLISEYRQYFSREKAVEFGHKKMRHITEGINAIEKSTQSPVKKNRQKIEIFTKITPTMPSTEIEALIEDIVNEQ